MSGPGPIAPALLAWFRQNARALPFRQDPTPYHIWVSEIMLQQTRVAAALEHYRRFMEALPDVPALAACPDEELFKLWEGLLFPGAQPEKGGAAGVQRVRRAAARNL